jgi:hypothetical protein
MEDVTRQLVEALEYVLEYEKNSHEDSKCYDDPTIKKWNKLVKEAKAKLK